MGWAGQRQHAPARERWFWLGVGLVSALGVFLLVLALVVTLAARARAKRVVSQQSALPARHSLKSTASRHPAPPKKPSARVEHARTPTPRVRIVERPVPDKRVAHAANAVPSGAPAPAPESRAPMRRVDPKPQAPMLPTPQPSPPIAPPPTADRVAGTRQEWQTLPLPGEQNRPPAPPKPADDLTGVTPPRLITSRGAAYPTSAMEDGVTGKVRVRLNISPDGFVDHAAITRSSGDARLDAAAARAALSWRYHPAQRYGRPVPSTDIVQFEFFRRGGESRPGFRP